ncbi:MAG: alpha/beta hydrolase fold domain-containing protein [Acidobacteria bacterium]|nr:alpha/beta hydrolase fold domain-containing protein [Acidobacteriota bacterium]
MLDLQRMAKWALLAALCVGPGWAQEDPGAPVPPPDVPPDEVFELWPGRPPGQTKDVGEEIMLVERRRPFYQITNVSKPTVSVYLPDPKKATGAAIMVYPGGGLVRLAIEHEGFEIAEWLREQGVAAFVVKYRVPPQEDNPRERWKTGVQDAQRAISLVRSRAKEFHIDPEGIGAIGFSAGGEIGTWLSINPARQYEPVDAADKQPTRPAFMLNIYPGGLAFGFRGQEPKVREDVLALLDEKTPPMFFAHAFPDASMNSILMVAEMRKRNLPAELHIFQDGAHGFGRRGTGAPLGVWTELALAWMRSQGFLDRWPVRRYAPQLTQALESNQRTLPRLTAIDAKATLDDAYAAQKRVIRAGFGDQKVIGYKGAASSAGAMRRFKINAPMHCAMFAPAAHKASETASLPVEKDGLIESEIGYVMGVDIPTRIEDADEARTATQAVMAAFELPTDLNARMGEGLTAADFIASNCGGGTRIVLGPEHHPDKLDLSKLPVKLTHDGKVLHETTAASTEGGQWENLKVLVNDIIDRGGVIREGDIILSGAIGGPHPATAGKFAADYGELGTIAVELR